MADDHPTGEAELPACVLRVAVDTVADMVAITDAAGRLLYANGAFLNGAGKRLDELSGQDVVALLGGGGDTGRDLRISIETGSAWRAETTTRRRDGTFDWHSVALTPVRDTSGTTTHFVVVRHDITEQKATEERLRQLALHDNLTGLPNRVLLMDRLEHALTRLRRSARNVAVLFIDIDDFKAVNDAFGHAAGDWLLATATRRLQQYLRTGDTAARLGGDEIVVLLEGISSDGEARRIAERIISAFENPFNVRGQDVQLSVSVGVAITGNSESNSEQLLQAAGAAMYLAKQDSTACYHLDDIDQYD